MVIARGRVPLELPPCSSAPISLGWDSQAEMQGLLTGYLSVGDLK